MGCLFGRRDQRRLGMYRARRALHLTMRDTSGFVRQADLFIGALGVNFRFCGRAGDVLSPAQVSYTGDVFMECRTFS
jgi:hypothetical protein